MMDKTGFPIQAFGNDRSVVILRSLEIVGNDRLREKIHRLCKYRTFIGLKSGKSQTIVGLLIHRMCIWGYKMMKLS